MKTPPPARLLLPLVFFTAGALSASPHPDYLVLPRTFTEDFNTLDRAKWTDFANRPNVAVSAGELRLTQLYLDSAPNTDANKPEHWTTGGVFTPDFAQKYGYYEVRMRIAPGWGLDNAFWFLTHNSSFHDNIEIDAPEIFSRAIRQVDAQGNTIPSTETYSATDDTFFVFNVYDHAHRTPAGGLTKIYRHNFRTDSPLKDNPATSVNEAVQFVTWGVEWKTDDTLAFYRDGVLITDPEKLSDDRVSEGFPSYKLKEAIDRAQAFSAVYPIFTTLPESWLGIQNSPSASTKPPLHGKFMGVAHFYAYQKPGWSGAGGSAWNVATNWGPDGVPGAGKAAVFNQPATSTTVQIPAFQGVKSLYFDRASVPAFTLQGGPLWLGANVRAEGVGGILMTPQVVTSQTIRANIEARRTLQFANLAKPASGPAPELLLDCTLSASVATSPSLHFNAVSPITAAKAIAASIGSITKWGSGRVTLASEDNAFTGGVTLVNGPLHVSALANGGQPSSLGASSSAAANLVVQPVYKHSGDNIARLVYTGGAASTDRHFTLAGAAQLELDVATGPLTWNGSLNYAPGANSDDAYLRLRGAGLVTFAGEIADTAAKPLRIEKIESGSWRFTGGVVLHGNFLVRAGVVELVGDRVQDFRAARVQLRDSATFILNPSLDATFPVLVDGQPATSSPALRKKGPHRLTLSAASPFLSRTFVDEGTLQLGGGGSLAGPVTVAAGATLRLVGSGAWPVGGSITNNGTIDLQNWTGSTPSNLNGHVLR